MCESRATLISVGASGEEHPFGISYLPIHPFQTSHPEGAEAILVYFCTEGSVSIEVMRLCRYRRWAWITLGSVMNRRLIPCFPIFMLRWGCFWGRWWYSLEFSCRFSQTSLSLLENNFISKRNAVFISSSSFAPFLGSCPCGGWEGEFLGPTWNKVKFSLVGSSGSLREKPHTNNTALVYFIQRLSHHLKRTE